MSGGGLSNIASQVGQMGPSGGAAPAAQPTPYKFNQPNTGWNQQQFTIDPNKMSGTQNWWTNTEAGKAAGGQEGLNKTLRTQIQAAMGNYGNMVDYANKTGISQQDIQNAIGGNTDMYTYMNRPNYQQFGTNGQFNQPIYRSNYQNNANPLTAFNVSTYGTTPARSNASQWWQNQGATDQQYMDRLRSQAPSYQNMNIGDLARGMQQFGISPSDMQAAGSYGGSTYGGFNPGFNTPQMSAPFNPYTNSSGYGGMGGFMPQMQSPFSFQQQYNPYQMQTPFSYQPSYGGDNNYGGDFGGGFNMYTPVTQQPTQPIAPRSSGPSQAIVGRSSSLRGTPNVMARKAEGGIASLMDDVE